MEEQMENAQTNLCRGPISTFKITLCEIRACSSRHRTGTFHLHTYNIIVYHKNTFSSISNILRNINYEETCWFASATRSTTKEKKINKITNRKRKQKNPTWPISIYRYRQQNWSSECETKMLTWNMKIEYRFVFYSVVFHSS